MKILTWNLQRPKKANQAILDTLAAFNADILILTETNAAIHPGEAYAVVATTPLPKGHDGIDYASGENRTTIWSKYKVAGRHETYDGFTAVCATLETEYGLLDVYGTIVGVFGGRGARFKQDFESQLLDFEQLCHENACCIAGDFNVTFSGVVYPSHDARNRMKAIFEKLCLQNVTSGIDDSVDHIALSHHFVSGKKYEIAVWNEDKKGSDHIGICVYLG